MTNNELEHLLKTAEVPVRHSFRENFSKNVMRRIRNASSNPDNGRCQKLNFAFLGVGFATVCLVIGFWIGFRNGHSRGTHDQLAVARKYFEELKLLFPNQLKSIIFDENGLQLVLSETADVPESPPVFVRIHGETGWKNVVTFSGQQIRVNGENWDVLVDSGGKVLLMGPGVFWSSELATREAVLLQVEAFPLEKSL